MFTDCPGC